MVILGIETSCDETSAAIIEGETKAEPVRCLSNISSTSLDLHARTGGIIPEIAAREQIKYIIPVVKKALLDANKRQEDIDAIAITYGPGLIGSLLIGVETARALAFAWNKPLIPVNHLFGHIYANWIATESANRSSIEFPAIALVVSGGHTDLVLMHHHAEYQWLGGTRDDAAGEAIDKIGRELNFPYPSGPAFEQAALHGNAKTYRLPRPIMYDNQYDFSFSGLKTAALREIKKQPLDQHSVNNLARGVQDAIIDVLVYKSIKAAEEFAVTSIILSGGVSANQTLRDIFTQKINDKQLLFTLYAPEKSFCTDNAAMIATAAFYTGSTIPWQKLTANPELYFD